MSFLAPYAFTGAVSLYLSYKTYTSYYSNCEFEEIQEEEIKSICVEENQNTNDEVEDTAKEIVNNIIEEVVKNREELVNDNKMKGDEIKIIIEDINKKEKFNYNNIDKLINKTLDKIEKVELNKIEEVELNKIEEVELNKSEVSKYEDADKREENVVLSKNLDLPFPEKKKNGKKKKKKRNKK